MNTKLLIKFIFALSLFMVSCSQSEEQLQKTKVIEIEAPIAIQNLSYENNILYMEDFVRNVEQIDSVIIDGQNIGFYQTKKQIAFQSSNFKKPLLLMRIWVHKKSIDILLKKSSKQKYLFSFNPHGISYDSVQIAGDINGWTPSRTKLEWHDSSWQQVLFLAPGKYAYQMVGNNKWMLDANNSLTIPNGQGGENSVLNVGDDHDLNRPRLASKFFNNNDIFFTASNHPQGVYIFWNNQLIPYSSDSNSDSIFTCKIPKEAKDYSLSYIRVFSYNQYGVSNDLLIPLVDGNVTTTTNELPRTAWHTIILYNVFMDRFYDGDSTNNKPLPDSIVLAKANYNGGDMQGVIQKIKEGYFKNLGVNSLWLSPVVKNTEEAFGFWPNPKTKFSAYHGYWPVSFTQINPHFGNDTDLEELVRTAHQYNSNVILDMVANHVHQDHPYYKAHPENATELHLPDGSLNLERWDDHRLTTWFDKFLPTLDLEKAEVAQMLADSIVWWAKKYDLDGFRYDAAKHIPLSFWRTLTKELKDSIISSGQAIYQLGETYGSSELINSYISSGLLDAQFDFNVYDAALSVFAGGNNMDILSEKLTESLHTYGDHNLMANITGNQDRGRFISYAGGALKFDEDAKVAGWTRDVEIDDSIAYKKLQLLMAFNMTIPGIPVIYYGDEFGMPGGNDPDCRRMMRFGDDLSEIEKENLSVTKKLIKLRRSNMAFLYGDFSLTNDRESMTISRRYFNQFAWVGFNNSDKPITFTIKLNTVHKPSNVLSHFGNSFVIENNKIIIQIPYNSFEIITLNDDYKILN